MFIYREQIKKPHIHLINDDFKNQIDAIIGMPAGLFYSTGIPTVVLVLKKNRTNKDILFIDDMHNVLKGSSKERDTDISSMIGSVLSEGDIRIIGTTNFKEYRNSVESNTSISRKLQKIIIQQKI